MANSNGLGRPHRRERARLADPAGTPCPFCALPMYLDQRLEADHSVPRALGGGGALRWAHAKCNAAAGGRLSHELRGIPARKWVDRWA